MTGPLFTAAILGYALGVLSLALGWTVAEWWNTRAATRRTREYLRVAEARLAQQRVERTMQRARDAMEVERFLRDLNAPQAADDDPETYGV